MTQYPTKEMHISEEIVQCYEQLLVLFQSPEEIKSQTTAQLIETCIEKLNIFLDSETYVSTQCQLQSQIKNALSLLRQQMFEFKKARSFLLTQNITSSNRSVYNVISSQSCVPQAFSQLSYLSSSDSSKQLNSAESSEKLLLDVESMVVKPKVNGLQDIAGMDNIKKDLITIMLLPLYQPQLFTERKISNTVLLYGPPGTGKTCIAHALAAEMSGSLYSVISGNILSQYVGQSERMVSALFKSIKEVSDKPKILFMDEVDGLFQRRHNNESDAIRRLKTQLMCELTNFEDVSNVYLICATNCPWDIDPAFLRRFQRRLYIPLPNRSERTELFKLLTQQSSLHILPKEWGPLLNKTEGFSGSDIADLIRKALDIPLSELLENKLWEVVGDNYRPAVLGESASHNIIQCDLQELPNNSIQGRDAKFADLLAAFNDIKRTISDHDIKKYENFNC